MRNQETDKNRNWRRANSTGKKLYEMNKHAKTIFAAMRFRVKECEVQLC